MAVAVRADLSAISNYDPGRRFEGTVNLAHTESAVPLSASVLDAITSSAAGANRYPSAGADALVERLAEFHHVEPTRMIVGAGAIALCAQFLNAVCEPDDEVVFPELSSPVYPTLVRVARGQPRPVSMLGGHWIDVDAILGAITPKTKVVLVGSPHSPTGTVLAAEQLHRLVTEAPSNVLLLFNEAFFDYVTDPRARSAFLFVFDRDNVAVLRTFSAASGLAGLRIGYCVAPAGVCAAARKVAVPYSVSHVAQVAALASLDHSTRLFASSQVAQERLRIGESLRAARFPVPPGSQANFVWVPLGELTTSFADHLLDMNIIVRAYPGRGVRVTVGRPVDNSEFLAAAAAWPQLAEMPREEPPLSG